MSQLTPVMWTLVVNGETQILPGWYLGLDQFFAAAVLWPSTGNIVNPGSWLPLYETWWQ